MPNKGAGLILHVDKLIPGIQQVGHGLGGWDCVVRVGRKDWGAITAAGIEYRISSVSQFWL